MNLALQLQTIKSTDVTIDSCAFGDLSARTFKIKLNFLFTTFKVVINQWLGNLDIVFPDQIGGLFMLSDLTIEYYNNYIFAGMTPTFIGEP